VTARVVVTLRLVVAGRDFEQARQHAADVVEEIRARGVQVERAEEVVELPRALRPAARRTRGVVSW
jgi:hypothetical protein